ncbi:MAG: biotin--[acetyl-CoA-carboxylase] ligase [Bacteroidetes bacterium]|nr:biotin--[acetyl-CoA-carboxylase] ligase [Bacteroidota bacterium]
MIGKRIIELGSIGSTNVYASEVHTAAEFEDGDVIWTQEQFAGRGQQNHSWISEPGKNLTFTVCLKPRFLAPDRQFQLNKAISLGVLDFLRSFHPFPTNVPHRVLHIKWPNDIYVDDLKIGGILIENRIMGSVFESSVAGIGVNVNQTGFAPEIPNPVSLFQIFGHEILLKEALLSLCRFLDFRHVELQQTDQGNLDREYDHNLLGYNQWRSFMHGGVPLEGRIKGVDDSGRLLVETRDGKILGLCHGEIEFQITC